MSGEVLILMWQPSICLTCLLDDQGYNFKRNNKNKFIVLVGGGSFLLFLTKSNAFDELRLEPNLLETEVEGSKDLLGEVFSACAG